MDWSKVTAGRLLTGDCNGGMHLWDVVAGKELAAKPSWDVSSASYSGHAGSVEDVQWSPNESNV
jgi:ribosome assembly protein RRB1